jgi:flagellar basal-body rod modification protein FlgD
MQTSSVSAATTTQATETTQTQSTQTGMEGLGQDAFLTLLLAQLKNQDPLKPMEDTDFIAQLAQFNSLNQLTQLNTTMKEMATSQSLAQSSALIGKTVTGTSNDAGTVTGLVSSLRLTSGKVILEVDGHDLPLERVNSVQAESEGG